MFKTKSESSLFSLYVLLSKHCRRYRLMEYRRDEVDMQIMLDVVSAAVDKFEELLEEKLEERKNNI